MKLYRFYIWQVPHCWQIVAPTLAEAIQKWRARGTYPGIWSPIVGRPDAQPRAERIQ